MIVLVPLSSVDVPFVFNEVSSDFQEVTIQGQLTYRVADPKQLARLLERWRADIKARPLGPQPALAWGLGPHSYSRVAK